MTLGAEGWKSTCLLCTQTPQSWPEPARTHSTRILDSPQKAPSVSLPRLFRWSLSTSKLSRPWNVRPSISRIRFRLRSLKREGW